MAKSINHRDIVDIYKICLDNAFRNFNKGYYEKSCIDLTAVAYCGYLTNFIYSDTKAEDLLHSIREKVLSQKKIKKPIPNRYVLLDTNGVDDHGLTQQYLRSMIHNGNEFLFITLREDISPLKQTIQEILHYGELGHIVHFSDLHLNAFDKVKFIVNKIIEFSPSKLFVHIMPWDYVSLFVVDSIAGVEKYNINLTDHAYWLGASFFDYNIEMRPYGRTVSIEKRGFKESQIIELPFYPITYEQGPKFEGFPQMPDDAIIIFTGGSPYKMSGDNDFFFTKIISTLLSLSTKVHILIAGYPNESMELEKKVQSIDGRDRIHNIGIRKDINEVFKRCDIYLGTYPIMGGLMSQYAAIYGKPIIAMKRSGDELSDVGSFVNHFDNVVHTYEHLYDFTNYARRLICEEDYRKSEGLILSKAVMTEDKFAEIFRSTIKDKRNYFNFPDIAIDYDLVESLYLEMENKNHSLMNILWSIYKFKSFIMLKKYWRDLVPFISKKLKKKLLS